MKMAVASTFLTVDRGPNAPTPCRLWRAVILTAAPQAQSIQSPETRKENNDKYDTPVNASFRCPVPLAGGTEAQTRPLSGNRASCNVNHALTLRASTLSAGGMTASVALCSPVMESRPSGLRPHRHRWPGPNLFL